MPKFGMFMSKSKAYKFDQEVKGRHWIGNMNVRVTSSHGDRPVWQIWQANVKSKNSSRPNTETCQKPFKIDLEVKVQGRIWIMNVRDTLFYGDTTMCQIRLANVKPKEPTEWFLYITWTSFTGGIINVQTCINNDINIGRGLVLDLFIINKNSMCPRQKWLPVSDTLFKEKWQNKIKVNDSSITLLFGATNFKYTCIE